MSADLIPTSAGMILAEDILDLCLYTNYATNRDLGMSAERLAKYFAGARAFEEKYQKERELMEHRAANRKVCGRCGEKHAGGCSVAFESEYQSEQQAIRNGDRY